MAFHHIAKAVSAETGVTDSGASASVGTGVKPAAIRECHFEGGDCPVVNAVLSHLAILSEQAVSRGSVMDYIFQWDTFSIEAGTTAITLRGPSNIRSVKAQTRASSLSGDSRSGTHEHI